LQAEEITISRTFEALNVRIQDAKVYTLQDWDSKSGAKITSHVYTIGTIDTEARKDKGRAGDKAH
jgi:hypothetical protein